MNKNDSLIQKIDEICVNGRRNKHSYFQLQYFVIGKEPTIQGKIWACKRELIERRDTIDSLYDKLEELFDLKRIEEISIDKLKHSVSLEDEEKDIKIRFHLRKAKEINYQVVDINSKIKAKEEEANFLIGLYEKLITIEPEKDWESLEVQSEYWNARLTKEIESRLIMGMLPNVEDFKTALSLPNGMPVKETINKLIADRSETAKKLSNSSK